MPRLTTTQNFNRVDEWLDAEKLQHHGPVGHASARLMRSRDVVKIVTEQIRLNEIFWQSPGVDSECDEARALLVKFFHMIDLNQKLLPPPQVAWSVHFLA